MTRLARATLLAYPRSFRDQFGADYLQAAADLRRHAHHSQLRVAWRLVGDAATTAPALRWEESMRSTKTVAAVALLIAGAVGLLLGGPLLAIALLVVAVSLALSAARHERPIAVEAQAWGRRWYLWLAAAGGLLGLGVAALLTSSDDELSSPAWLVWFFSWTSAGVVAAVGVALGVHRAIGLRRA